MTSGDELTSVVAEITAAATWNARVALIRQIPETFGKAQHQAVYAAVAEAIYVPHLAPDFAYVHWKGEYELSQVERAAKVSGVGLSEWARRVLLTSAVPAADERSDVRPCQPAPEEETAVGFVTQRACTAPLRRSQST